MLCHSKRVQTEYRRHFIRFSHGWFTFASSLELRSATRIPFCCSFAITNDASSVLRKQKYKATKQWSGMACGHILFSRPHLTSIGGLSTATKHSPSNRDSIRDAYSFERIEGNLSGGIAFGFRESLSRKLRLDSSVNGQATLSRRIVIDASLPTQHQLSC